MGKGHLQTRVFWGNQLFPARSDVEVRDAKGQVLVNHTTCENGHCPGLEVYAPPRDSHPPFALYDVTITPHDKGLRPVTVHGVQVFDGVNTVLPVHVHPTVGVPGQDKMEEIYIPQYHGIDLDRPAEPQDDEGANYYQAPHEIAGEEVIPVVAIPNANEVAIPTYITVHLGAPSANARNVRVPFKEYIKNCASSEIYPTWTRAALEANVLAITSFALNRIYTTWYRSRGRDFDITNNTQFDQMFIPGREIFQPIIDVVDDIFNQFLRRAGRREPFLSSYCNGTTSTCAGMSQWGSERMGQQGRTAMEILRHYYPNDIQVVQSTNFTDRVGTYPGEALREGSRGDAVRLMQRYLNRISGNWFMPPAGAVDGIFGPATLASVEAFQGIFNLTQDGVIGRRTWYEITRIYVAVMELAELTSQGERIGVKEPPPTSTLRLNARGADVVELQFLLDYVALFYEDLPHVVQSGVFRPDTLEAVQAFQRLFGLNADGVVGRNTWRMLYDVFFAIKNNIPKQAQAAMTESEPETVAVFKYGEAPALLAEELKTGGRELRSSDVLMGVLLFLLLGRK